MYLMICVLSDRYLNMAKSKKDTRSSITTVKFQLKEYKATDTYETKSKLPSGQYLRRMIHLCQSQECQRLVWCARFL